MRALRSRTIFVFAGAAAGLVVPASAQAALSITQHVLLEDGSPGYVANGAPAGSTLSWVRCAPDCGGASLSAEQFFKPGPTAAGVTFQVSATVDGTAVETGTSKVWSGTPTNTGLPRLALGSIDQIRHVNGGLVGPEPLSAEAPAELSVGQSITPVAGTWTGGFPEDGSERGLRACPTAAGEGCVAIMGTPRSVSIDPAYAGWYLGAYETREANGTPKPAVYITTPVGLSKAPAPAPSAIRAFGPLTGPVKAVDLPKPSPSPGPVVDPPLGFTPKVSIRKRALKDGKRRTVASVSCPETCAGTVAFRQGKKTATTTFTVKGKKAIAWPSKLSTKSSVRVEFLFLRTTFTKKGTVKPA